MGLLDDLRFAARQLVAKPGFTIAVTLTLGLGIGSTSAMFGVVDAVLLRPLPFPDPERLVAIWERNDEAGVARNDPSPANFLDWRDQAESFESMAAYFPVASSLTGIDEPLRVEGYRVSGDFFSVLGIGASIGRALTPADDSPGAGATVVLSHGLWHALFGGEPAALGRTLVLNDVPTTVVGVMPPNFSFPASAAQFWLPMAMTPEEAANRGAHYLAVIGRLKDRATLAEARSESSAIASRLAAAYPRTNEGIGVSVYPLHEEMVADLRSTLLAVFGAIGLLLLIACTNVANLMLARGAGRDREIGLRAALGGSRGRLLRLLFSEALLVSLIGAAAGLLAASWGIDYLGGLVEGRTPLANRVQIDGRALAFTGAVAVASAVLFGLIPAIRISRPDLARVLKEGGTRTTASGARGQRLLIIAETTLALVLLVSAGLMIRSFLRLVNEDPGFEPTGVLTARLQLPEPRYEDRERKLEFYDRLLERVGVLQGIESVGLITFIPMTFGGGSVVVEIEGRPPPRPSEGPWELQRIISVGYLEAMGIAVRGRTFTAADRDPAPPVVVVNESFARRYWPGEEAIGKRMRVDAAGPWATVVGVAGDVRQVAMESEPRPEFYLPYRQGTPVGFFLPRDLVIRASVAPASLGPAIRAAVKEIDPNVPVADIRTMSEVLSGSIASRSLYMGLFAFFAGAALALSAIGVYGVLAFYVTQRERELGIRMALGARGWDVVRLVVGQGMAVTAAGLALGALLAVAASRALSSLLYKVEPEDPLTFLAVGILLAATALLATLLPARRASRLDPACTLRVE